MVPKALLIGMLVNPSNPSAETDIGDVQRAAAALDQQIVFLRAGNEREIDAAFEMVVRQRANALLVAHDPYFLSRRKQFITQAARHKIPAIYEFREFVLDGG
jgi:putative ABC transport system substrate-binding protein